MAVGQASGVALLVAAEHGCRVVEYTSNEVKLAVAGYGSADKTQVQQMVARLLRSGERARPARRRRRARPRALSPRGVPLRGSRALRPGEGSPGPREARR